MLPCGNFMNDTKILVSKINHLYILVENEILFSCVSDYILYFTQTKRYVYYFTYFPSMDNIYMHFGAFSVCKL